VFVVSFMVPFLSLVVLSSDPDGRTDLIGRGTIRAAVHAVLFLPP
jgi:hypothetical protein